ncbi:hypothetical protein FB567DRAFT_434387 [Paraphoma chrysanthemicola]|uniref:Glycosyl transferase family 1 domain-containing protein n=1 Tax=Paraphoma chrysanthemicola TaxID=798071 RepID=A0A8K0RIA9_9PLEO|nr:hypothetical protein FB567DRAFT_434387 [Paraphoma chrysanthemicola]
MRVFLVQTAKGLFSSSGGYKANICLLRYLASRGHAVRQLCYSYRGEIEAYAGSTTNSSGKNLELLVRSLYLSNANNTSGTSVKVEEMVMDDGVQVVALENEAFELAFGGKEIMCKELGQDTANYIEAGKLSTRLFDFVSFLQDEITRFSPTHIICNDGLTLKATSALAIPRIKVCRIGVIHTAEQLPFGPFAGGVPGHVSSAGEFDLLKQLDGIWSVSNAIKQYAFEHGHLETSFFVHHPWTYLEEKTHSLPAHHHNWDKPYIGMINPCAVKGSHILLNLAKSCPQHNFLVYKSWGFSDEIGKQMKDLQNITVRPSCKDMEEAWRDIKILLVPSLWLEAWGIVLIEAHLRGIPVISSDAGALPEAMLGLDHIVPVEPLDGQRDHNGEYFVPAQSIEPWIKMVDILTSSKIEYERLSAEVREKTAQWLEKVDEAALEIWLSELAMRSKKID